MRKDVIGGFGFVRLTIWVKCRTLDVRTLTMSRRGRIVLSMNTSEAVVAYKNDLGATEFAWRCVGRGLCGHIFRHYRSIGFDERPSGPLIVVSRNFYLQNQGALESMNMDGAMHLFVII